MKQLEVPKHNFINDSNVNLISTWEFEWPWFNFHNRRYSILLKYKVLFIDQLGFKNY